ncbi:DEAD/DEAH box helicase family protein [Sulfurimonas sp.]
MYKITVVSRCQNKALKETRKILDSFGLRISDKTWNCNITKEGLEFLINKLRKTARKNTAIAIYFLKENRLRLFCIIGNKNEFGRDGACPISTTSKKHSSFRDKNDYISMPFYKELAEFIGYSHDLGKVSGYFQSMLHSKKEMQSKDIFRHEFFTILILLSKDRDDLIKKLETIYDKKKYDEKKEINFLINSDDKILEFCCKVIVSHHKLANFQSATSELEFSNFFRIPMFRKDLNITKKDIENLLKHFNSDEFQVILKRKDKLYAKVLQHQDSITLEFEHFIYCRNALMLADHYISSKKYEEKEGYYLLAKSRKYGYETLNHHLYSVGKMSSYIINDFTNYRNNFMALSTNELEIVLKASRGKFKWQNESCREMLKISLQNDIPNLVILGAKTGAGKTRMALRVVTELNRNKELRLNVVLGLRTLTTQTANSYREMLDVSDEMIALIVGENNFDLKEDEEVSENDLGEELLINVDLKNGIIDNRLKSYILNSAQDFKSNIKTQKQQKIISTPIVVSTIDYMIKASDWRKSKHLLAQLRLMSSDLIIDEIDMYSKGDMLYVLNLIYITGLFGRNLIITTATISPTLADTIKYIFTLGVQGYHNYSGEKKNTKKINCHYLSDNYNKSEMVESTTIDFFAKILAKSAESMEDKLHKVKIVENVGINKSLLEYVSELHNFNKCKNSDYNYSIGLIKVEYIKSGFEMLQFFLKDESLDYFKGKDIKVNFVFYHARLPLAVRKKIELELDKALYRKSNNDPFLKSNIFLDNYKDEGYKNYITIVIATPVEEIGRDHDFDWCITEPKTSRSIIQTIGRVNRHRELKIIHPNAYVLNNLFDTSKSKRDILENFKSIENECSAKNIISPLEGEIPYLENEELFDFFEDNINANSFTLRGNKYLSDSLFSSAWRAGKVLEEYRYDFESDFFVQINERSREVKTEFKSKKLKNEQYSFINHDNFDDFIEKYEIDNNKKMKVMCDSERIIFFSKTLGII